MKLLVLKINIQSALLGATKVRVWPGQGTTEAEDLESWRVQLARRQLHAASTAEDALRAESLARIAGMVVYAASLLTLLCWLLVLASKQAAPETIASAAAAWAIYSSFPFWAFQRLASQMRFDEE